MSKMSACAGGGKRCRLFRSARWTAHPFGAGRLLLLAVLLLALPGLARAQVDSALGAAQSGSSLPNAPSPNLPVASPIAAQNQAQNQAQAEDQVTIHNLPANFLRDQAAIWTSPARIRSANLPPLITLFLATTVAITTDHQAMSSVVSHDPTFNNHNVQASNVLVGGFVGVPALLFLKGQFSASPGARETGILSGEAMADAMVVDEVLKAATMRERPALDGAKGKFFETGSGTDSSFPSSHSMVAWSSAAVLASESSAPLVQIGAYTLATGVSLARVLGQQHFPSDVLVGSALGWMIGRYVYHRHHRDVGY